jgi:2-polyprenyl-3-methyl-5-hydroxy-6-metoxy-1,4-benzoquinol methylase
MNRSSAVSAEQNKAIYREYHDQIIEKRFHSASPIRRHAHEAQYQAFVDLVPAGASVIDAGCGEGILSVMLAKQGCKVLGVDLSEPNIAAARRYAEEQGVSDRVSFQTGDAERLPAGDREFQFAVSSHVLEHLPDFDQGARELRRVASMSVILAIPTCVNPASMVLLGGDKYWVISRRTPLGWLIGLLRVLAAFFTGTEGVNETYVGNPDLIHIHRFPWRAKQRLERCGLRVIRYRASSFPIPYLPFAVPLSRALLAFCWLPMFRNFGFGTTYVCNLNR